MSAKSVAPIPVRVFTQCVRAIADGLMIKRVSSSDKEFHFQHWFRDRLQSLGENIESGGRNSYPDFRMVGFTDGFEVKGLAYPGREASFDSNSQLPTGHHNGRTIYYVFGRYPKQPDGNTYPVLDFVICHGDILIRARRMYVVPTPFHLARSSPVQNDVTPYEAVG